MSSKTGKIIGGITLSPFVLIALGIAYCEANKAYWDHQVKLMCEKDGGVTVFEKIELTKEEYERNDGNGGFIVPRLEKNSKIQHDFFKRQSTVFLKENNPSIKRLEFSTYRKSDGKILGKTVVYGRAGGDFPTGISAGSSFACDDIDGVSLDAEKQIFSYKGE